MIQAALRKIEAELAELAANTDAEHPVDPFELKLIARKVGAQAEMLEQGIAE